MAKISIWKRVGGWLRRSQLPSSDSQAVRLDTEGLLVESEEQSDSQVELASDQANSTLSPRMSKKDQPLVAMQEGFTRLAEVLESINDNILQQREANSEMKTLLQGLPDLTRVVPETLQGQRAQLAQLAEQLSSQSVSQQQTAEALKQLPDLGQTQLERLDDITRCLESSAENESRIVDSFQRLDAAMNQVAQSNQAQHHCLDQLGEKLQQNNERFQQQLTTQNRRFAWLVGLVILAGLLAAAAVTVVVLLAQRQPAGGG